MLFPEYQSSIIENYLFYSQYAQLGSVIYSALRGHGCPFLSFLAIMTHAFIYFVLLGEWDPLNKLFIQEGRLFFLQEDSTCYKGCLSCCYAVGPVCRVWQFSTRSCVYRPTRPWCLRVQSLRLPWFSSREQKISLKIGVHIKICCEISWVFSCHSLQSGCRVKIYGNLSRDFHTFLRFLEVLLSWESLVKPQKSDQIQPGKILKVIELVRYSIKSCKLPFLIYSESK